MSSGSYFTLYRKYKVKATDEVVASLKKQYVDFYKDNGSSVKKTDEEYLKDMPLVLETNYGKKESVFDKDTNTWVSTRNKSIAYERANYQAILNNDNSYIDELLTWNFCSSFTCLKEYWSLNPYNNQISQYCISISEAEKILQACEYLLSGNWSDDFEKILNNKWINVLADGNDSNSYWKYIYRNDKKSLREIPRDEQESAEYDIKHLKHLLDAYVNADEDYENDYVLVYTVW